jgi:hypothetical protein
MWMKQADNRLTDVDEELGGKFLEHHLPGCRCTTSALHPRFNGPPIFPRVLATVTLALFQEYLPR